MYIIDNLHIKIKKAAARKNITLKILAIDMDLTEQGLHNILKRDNMPLDKFLNMAKGLDMRPDELLNYITTNTDANEVKKDAEPFIKSDGNKFIELMHEVIKTNKIIEDILKSKQN